MTSTVHSLLVAALILLSSQVLGAPSQVQEKAGQIFDAARQTVTDVVGVAQGVVNQAIDAAKNTVINDIDTVQDAARLGVETGRNIIEFGENTILRMLNGTGK